MAADFLQFRAKPNLDKKWLRANLTSALRSVDELANIWNHLLEDNEVLETDNRVAGPSFTFIDESVDTKVSDTNQTSTVTSETIFNNWLWNPIPCNEEKQDCIKTLLNEQQNLCHQAAENCLSLQNLKRILYVYNRYFIALSRFKAEQQVEEAKVMSESHSVTVETKVNITKLELSSENLPNKLCTQCMRKLQVFVRFWNVSQYSESRVDEWKTNNRQEMMNIFLTLSSDEEDSGVSETKSSVQTVDDDMSSVSNDEEQSKAKKELALKKIYGKIVQEEEENFQLKESDKEELLKNFFDIPISSTIEINDNNEEYFTCGTCALSFRHKSSVMEHIKRRHYNESNVLDDCDGEKSWKVMSLVVPAKFTRNLRPMLTTKAFGEGRPRIRSFQCRVCDKSYFSRSYLMPHVCVPAGSTFQAVKTTYRTVERNFKCDTCGLTFARKSSLFGHIKITHAPICY